MNPDERILEAQISHHAPMITKEGELTVNLRILELPSWDMIVE